jgi:single-stranded DNA-binding protein
MKKVLMTLTLLIVLYGRNIAQNTAEYVKKGDLLGIKGRVETDDYEKDGQKHKATKIVAEKVTFLSSSKLKDNEDEPEV